MLLTPRSSNSIATRERVRLLFGFLLIGVLLLMLLWTPGSTIPVPPPDAIFCDAEHTNEKVFINGDYTFEGLTYRTKDRAHSGEYSILLPGDGQAHFGFTTVLDGIQPGDVYEISIWSYGNEAGDAQLVVQGREPSGLYLESDVIEERNSENWSLQKIKVSVPFGNAPKQLAVFVYSNGGRTVFFDDLMIQRIQAWDSGAFQPKKIVLNFDSKSWRKLDNIRQRAFEKGILQSTDDDWVKAQIGEGAKDNLMDAKVRLKGDWLDHLKGDKWSYRIKLSNGAAWNGMNTFSLHTPEARYFLHEWLLHRFWASTDVLTTRYDFAELIVNGESKGIYAYEEHFAKQLVESQNRREGPIMKFSEDGFWATTARQFEHHGFIKNESLHSGQRLANAPIMAFQEEQWLADSLLLGQYKNAKQLLELFRNGAVPADQVFDLERMANYYAICDLLNAYHGVIWHNQRFYYNPVIGKLEPIGFDGFADKPMARYHFLGEGAMQIEALEGQSLLAYFLQDKKFVSLYFGALETYTRLGYWEVFWQNLETEWKARLQWLQLEFPEYDPTPEDIQNELAFIRSKLLPFKETSLRVYRKNTGQLKLQNTHSLPLIIKGYGYVDAEPSTYIETPIWLPATPIRKLWTKLEKEEQLNQFNEIRFWNQQALKEQSIPYFGEMNVPASARYVFYQIPGWDSLFSANIQKTSFDKDEIRIGASYPISQPENFSTLKWKENDKTIFIPRGEHVIDTDLIIGESQQLIIEEGADIDLKSGSAIISYGAVKAIGQEGFPIVFHSSDGTGQGLQVLQADEASVLRKVVFDGLRNLHKTNWTLTGAVTFYESPVKIVDCRFLDNQSEDGLNIIRSRFEMNNCLFQNTSSDAFDADFCKGTVTNSVFLETTNDGMDFSGSIITIQDCQLTSCHDKAISVGEASDVTVIDTKIKKSKLGIASKDKSLVQARNLFLSDCEQGLVVFQKKPEYGPAVLLVENLTVENVKQLYQKGEGSRLQVE